MVRAREGAPDGRRAALRPGAMPYEEDTLYDAPRPAMNRKRAMSRWEPDQYLKFAGPRLRPALDLLAAVPLVLAEQVYDLGCGTGNMAAHLSAKWPEAAITGVDSSAEMLAAARAAHPRVTWTRADLAAWVPEGMADILFSNAALQWLDDHGTLFPNLVRLIAPGGVLAVQMPRNFAAPSHTLIHEVAAQGPWAGRLEGVGRRDPVAAPEVYYEYLAPLARTLDIWETVYLHALEGADPVLEWSRGTALRPFLAALDPEEECAAFLAEYTRRVRAAYPPRRDGRTLFPFRRLFIVAQTA
jgi:trans-aconitate 2-methyltransferase